MNIYLDTNILFADPFFKSSFSELLLKSSIEKAVTIYIPNICLDELYFKLTDKARILDSEIKNKVRELHKLTNTAFDNTILDLKDYEKVIHEFYKEKIDNEIFISLANNTEFFTENLEKAIKGIAPFFTDKKEEFRDSLIWSTVRDHSSQSNETKNYLLTANYADFWNFEKTDLHPNLRKENTEITIVESIKKLFDIETSLIDFRKSQEFKKWLDQQGLTINSIQEAINKYLWNHIADSIDISIKKYSIKELSSEHDIGYIVPDIIKENFKIQNIEKITPVEDFATLEINTTLRFSGKLFLPNYEKGNFSNYESLSFIASILLSLSYGKDQIFKPLGTLINKIEIE